MCYYRYTMLHDIRPMGTVNLRETINLNFHSKIILPQVYFPFSSTFFMQKLKDPVTTSPHSTHLEKSLEMNVLHIFMIFEKGRGTLQNAAVPSIFVERKGVTGTTDLTAWYLVRMRRSVVWASAWNCPC